MRIFAGPNGSGKSTIIGEIQKQVRTGVYINADEIEKKCKQQRFLNLADYNLQSTPDHFNQFLKNSTLLTKAHEEGLLIDLTFSDNVIVIGTDTNSYEAALIAAYLRELLIKNNVTFSFETVMSHPSKIEILRESATAGYKNYLYFICTEDPSINIGRVEARVAKGGHNVPHNKIEERYYRSLDLLAAMVPYCHRCFVFDNSATEFRLIVEIVDGKDVVIHTEDEIPFWVDQYLLHPLGL
jgi:predicted ABC-type ATPase